jgi:hypothetical protein
MTIATIAAGATAAAEATATAISDVAPGALMTVTVTAIAVASPYRRRWRKREWIPMLTTCSMIRWSLQRISING